MNKEERLLLDQKEYPAVHRGMIYEFKDVEGHRLYGRYAVVLSGEHRSRDARVSVLVLSDERGRYPDAITVRVRGISYYGYCGLVTYCRRYQLGKVIGRAEEVEMMRIDAKLPVELGIQPAERQDFERLYYDTVELLDKEDEDDDVS